MFMKLLNSSICLLSAAVLTACSTMAPPDLAPASVAGKKVRLDDSQALWSECPVEGGNWSAWSAYKYGCAFDFPFDANNQYKLALNPCETTCMTYRKTGPASAEISCESAENAHTCHLTFTTPCSGTATKEGYGEGSQYKQRNIRFSIK